MRLTSEDMEQLRIVAEQSYGKPFDEFWMRFGKNLDTVVSNRLAADKFNDRRNACDERADYSADDSPCNGATGRIPMHPLLKGFLIGVAFFLALLFNALLFGALFM